MKHLASALGVIFSLALGNLALAQTQTLAEGTVIRLETRHDISSKSARVGDKVELAVAEPVKAGDIIVIPAGAPAVGEVARVRDNGLLGRSGKLNITVSKVKAGQWDVPVRGQRNSKGKAGTIGAVGAGIVFLPLAIIVRGKDAKLPAGTAFDVYVDQDVPIALSSSEPAAEQPIAVLPDTNNP